MVIYLQGRNRHLLFALNNRTSLSGPLSYSAQRLLKKREGSMVTRSGELDVNGEGEGEDLRKGPGHKIYSSQRRAASLYHLFVPPSRPSWTWALSIPFVLSRALPSGPIKEAYPSSPYKAGQSRDGSRRQRIKVRRREGRRSQRVHKKG